MLTVFLWRILAFVAAVYCQEELKDLLDFSNITSKISLYPHRDVEPTSVEASPEIDSSEHGVTPGKMETNCTCGRANRGGARIIGGRQFQPFEYPFLALISLSTDPERPHCGSTIISDRHLLTAAHCTSKAGGNIGLLVTVAVHEIGNSPKSYTVEVERLIQHENYNERNLLNDISLLYLKNPLQLTEVVSPACMPLPGMSVIGKYVRVIGWGATEAYGPMTVLPQKVDLEVISTEKCHEYWQLQVATDPVTQICRMWENKSACHGDSGGPVVWLDPDTNRYTSVGIVSFGLPCKSSVPNMDTSVVSYLPWIMKGIEATTPGRKLCTKIVN
uniref:Pc97, similar to serine protease n=1 Tax=Panstrongylus chinai TaxID=156444 RepID=A0A286P0V9_9HEMI|nr:Pc97, similar to serine protease [Panstrongylus chinai]